LQRFGQFLVLHPAQVMRGDEQPVIRRQPRDCFFQPIAHFEIGELTIGGRQRVGVVRLVERRRARRTPVILQADVGDDAVDPCRQARLAAKVRQPAVDAQKNILREIFGARSVLDRARDQGEHEIFVSIDQLLKCPFVPGAAAFDELALVDIFHPPPY